MIKLDHEDMAQAKPNPIFEGLPDELKEPEKYKEVEEKLAEAVKSPHKHRRVAKFVECKSCQKRAEKRKELMQEYGFSSIQQYLEWKKIMNIIINKEDIVL